MREASSKRDCLSVCVSVCLYVTLFYKFVKEVWLIDRQTDTQTDAHTIPFRRCFSHQKWAVYPLNLRNKKKQVSIFVFPKFFNFFRTSKGGGGFIPVGQFRTHGGGGSKNPDSSRMSLMDGLLWDYCKWQGKTYEGCGSGLSPRVYRPFLAEKRRFFCETQKRGKYENEKKLT